MDAEKTKPNLTTCAGIRKYVTQMNDTLPYVIINQILEDKEYDSIEDFNEDDTEIMCREFKVPYRRKKTKKVKEEERIDNLFKDGPIGINTESLNYMKVTFYKRAAQIIKFLWDKEYGNDVPGITAVITLDFEGFEDNNKYDITEMETLAGPGMYELMMTDELNRTEL